MQKPSYCVAMIALSTVLYAQSPLLPSDQASFSVAPDSGASRVFERRILEQQSMQRQAALKRDTDKLLELASQLKQNVDRTNANVLSMDVIKKAQEIEKLAKSVKEKMKGD